LLAVKSGFILFIKDYQFSLQINTLERERERPSFFRETIFQGNKMTVDKVLTITILKCVLYKGSDLRIRVQTSPKINIFSAAASRAGFVSYKNVSR
jgi:hypothetical protein